jgi:hypothetical protein
MIQMFQREIEMDRRSKPVPIISKFVDIVTNGLSDRMFNIKAYSQDQYYGVSKRTEQVHGR